MHNRDGTRTGISVLNFPLICTPLPTSVDVRDYSHLDGLELADYKDSDVGGAIDVLIGSDYYWDFVTGETIRGEGGPTAVGSTLGWMIS